MKQLEVDCEKPQLVRFTVLCLALVVAQIVINAQDPAALNELRKPVGFKIAKEQFMQKTSLLIVVLLFLALNNVRTTRAQQPNEPSEIEIGGQFTSVAVGPQVQPIFIIFDHATSEVGLGGRFTYNLNRHVAVEAEGNFFTRTHFGRIVQGQFGVKAGKRFDKFGIFAKGRPGFVSFSEVLTQTGTQTIVGSAQTIVIPTLDVRRRTFFSIDVGTVLEFYPSRRIVVRFDAGDTMINVGNRPPGPYFGTPPSDGLTHHFQFSSGVGVRLLNPKSKQDTESFKSGGVRKFEAGVQFSSINLDLSAETILPLLGGEFEDNQSGFGGRLTYNFTPNVAAEIQTDFFPRDLESFHSNGRVGGSILQVQAGGKVGKRFRKFGLFGKARPGAISYGKTLKFDFSQNPLRPTLSIKRETYFSLDLGGVVEFYPSPRIIARFDAGDTMIRYSATRLPFTVQSMPIITLPAETRHQFQFSAGVGFRF